MLKNYLKITLRNLRLRRSYTVINLAGLATGLTCCLLILMYIQHEAGYDKHHTYSDRIQRIVIDYTTGDITREQGYTQGLLGPVLVNEIPEVEAAVRMLNTGGVFSTEDLVFTERSMLVADASFFSVFSFDLLRGDPETALAAPGSIVLTEEIARKYFGDNDPVGQSILYNNDQDLTVTGIVKAPPAQSHIDFDALISMSTLENEQAPSWMFSEWLSTFVQTYVLIREGASPAVVEQKMAAIVEREAGDMMRQAGRWVTLLLEPLESIYLTSTRDGLGNQGSLTNLYLFGFIALFILTIACINFTNLATAQAMLRAREIGVRKTMGAGRNQLILQFLGEAFCFSIIAMGMALVFSWWLLPAFNELAGSQIPVETLPGRQFFLWMFLIAIIVTFLAGGYPALYLSRFRPAIVLKGKDGAMTGGKWLRKGLVVFQFAVSVALIVATGIVYQQLQFMKNQELGFDKEHVLVLNFGGDERVRDQVDVIKREINDVPGVISVAASQTVPGWGLPQSGGTVRLSNGVSEEISAGLYMVDYDFIDFYQMNMVAGRPFSDSRSSDSLAAYILNETAVTSLGLASPEEALGVEAGFWGIEGRVIGVMQDIHHYALQTQVSPMAMRIDNGFNISLLSIRLAPGNLQQTVQNLQRRWAEVAPHRPFDFQFLDASFDAQYRAEEQFGSVFITFTVLALLIACLGLLGLAAFMVQRRTKEIGVRKVMGASTQSVLILLSKDYARLVVLGVLVASPLIYLAMNRWLESFPYRTEVSWWLFAGAGLSALLIAWLTVSVQAFRAARANPVEVLRYE